MSVFTSLIIILLAMLIQSFLELSPGLFAIYYHHALGKTSAKKADDQSLSFILGVEICVAIVFLTIYVIVNFLITEIGFTSPIIIWIISGIFLLEAIFTFFFYFKPVKSKKSTILFLSRRLAKGLIYHVEHAKNRSDTIILGFVTCALELFLTMPLYIIASICIYYNFLSSNFIFIIAYVIIATIPLFVIRTFYRTNHNLVEIQHTRIKKKLPTKFILSISYLLLAIVTFTIGFSL